MSTAAFGFSLPDLPRVIGPFGLIDGRVSLSTPVFDARALQGVRSVNATLTRPPAGRRATLPLFRRRSPLEAHQ